MKKVPRPLNCFMTYRLEKQREILKKCPGANHRDISKITAKWWKELSPSEKEPYRQQAERAKIEHVKLYPDYKFNPKKKLTKTRVYKKRTEDEYTAEDIEQKRRLLTLYHQNDNLAPADQQQQQQYAKEKTDDICCAHCYSSSTSSTSKTCFTKTFHVDNSHKLFLPIPVLSSSALFPSIPYTTSGYYSSANNSINLNYKRIYPYHQHHLASDIQPSYADSYRTPTPNHYYGHHNNSPPSSSSEFNIENKKD